MRLSTWLYVIICICESVFNRYIPEKYGHILTNLITYHQVHVTPVTFLPRCMECRRGLAIRIPSVRPSVTRVIPDKMEERSVQIFILYERSFSLVFSEEEWLVGVDPFYVKFSSTDHRWSKIADFQPIFGFSVSSLLLTYIGLCCSRNSVQFLRGHRD